MKDSGLWCQIKLELSLHQAFIIYTKTLKYQRVKVWGRVRARLTHILAHCLCADYRVKQSVELEALCLHRNVQIACLYSKWKLQAKHSKEKTSACRWWSGSLADGFVCVKPICGSAQERMCCGFSLANCSKWTSQDCLFVGCSISQQHANSGTDLPRQFYVLPHWDRSCRSNFLLHPVTVYWYRSNQSQCRPCNARRLTG